MGLDFIRQLKENAGKPKPKKPYVIPKKSAKKLKMEKELAVVNDTSDTLKEQWFKARRKELTGYCKCGCGNRTTMQDKMQDDKYFRSYIAHIFPKRIFESVMYHPLNFVERAFWGGCHSVMDDTSMERWKGFADWEDIRERFFILAPLLTDEERKTKFYTQLESLVYKS